MNVSEKLALYEEFKRSKLKVGGFARKRMISDTVMRRIVADVTSGKFNEKTSCSTAKRIRTSPYDVVERKLVDYIEFRVLMHKNGHDKCGLSYDILQLKALDWAKELLST